jgi:hypothetical protein
VHQDEHLARIEQGASSNSGDTYSPLGRLRDEISVVGDIVRYWQVPLGGLRDSDIYARPGGGAGGGAWPADLQAFVGLRGVIRLLFAPRLGVATETDLEIYVEVGVGTLAQLKVTLTLRP